MGFRALLLLCGISTASAFAPCGFSGQGALACTAKSAISKSAQMAAARVPLGARGILGLRAQAAGDAESPDPTVSKALGEAWIAADKAKTLKDLLGGSSLYLIGYPGCGKEGVGQMLGKRMDVYSFLDLKEVLAAAAGKPECGGYEELKEQIGIEDFRDLESKVMDQVQAVLRLVVSTDAGVVSDVSNWARMQNGLVVYLSSDVETLAKKSNMPADKIQAMMDEFGGFYELADIKVTVDPEDAIDHTAVKVIDSLLDLIKNNPPKRKEWQAEHDKRIAALEAEEKAKGKPGAPPGKGFAPKSGDV